jgi:hypothetical protein
MLNNNLNTSTSHISDENQEDEQITEIREIHALTPPRLPPPPPPTNRGGHSHRSSSLSMASTDSENFTTISREFNALVLAGSTVDPNNISPHEHETANSNNNNNNNNLRRIREEDHMMEETNPLAIVVDNNPFDPVPSPTSRRTTAGGSTRSSGQGGSEEHVSVDRVKKEEVDAKISAWQNAKVAKINNRFKRDDAVINGWESEQVQKATSWMKKVEVSVFSSSFSRCYLHVGFFFNRCYVFHAVVIISRLIKQDLLFATNFEPINT